MSVNTKEVKIVVDNGAGVKAAALPENVSFVAFNAVEFLVDEGDTQAKLK
eukprot:gene32492-17607_t